MVKCPRCGYENNRNSTYCVNCTYVLKDPNAKQQKRVASSGRSWSNTKTIKKVAIVLCIIVVAFIIFSLIYQMSLPEPENSLTVVTSNETGVQTSSTPYVVVIEYDGSWTATLGDNNNPIVYTGSGHFEKRLNCVAWDHIIVDVSKTDGGSGVLKVIVYNNGKVIFEDSTTAVNGTIHYELNN